MANSSNEDITLLNSLSGHSVSPWNLHDESNKETQSGLELANGTMKGLNDVDLQKDLPYEHKPKLDNESDPVPGLRLNDKSEDENNESNKFIKFKNSKGRMFRFPYTGIKKWKNMKAAIEETFTESDGDKTRTDVSEGHYDLLNEGDNMIILPKFWENIVKPGFKIRMEMWSKRMPNILQPPPPPPPGLLSLPPPPPPPMYMPPPPILSSIPPPPPPDFGPPIFRHSKKKGKRSKWSHCPPPGFSTRVDSIDWSKIEVIDRDIWKNEDQDIANAWIKTLSDEVKRSPLLRAPGMFRAPAGLRDDFKTKSEVLCGLLNLQPSVTATFIVHMLCKVEKNRTLLQEQWPDFMIVLLQTICENHLQRRKHGPDDTYSATRLKVDSMLSKVYRRGLLPLPTKEKPSPTYLSYPNRQVRIINSTASAMNIWSTDKFRVGFLFNPDADTSSVDSSFVETGCNFLRLDGLDIGSLLAMGKINIAWTDCLEKHLELEIDRSDDESVYTDMTTTDSTATLYIYWFDFFEYAWLGSYFTPLDESELQDRAKEVRKTWSFLFSPKGFFRTGKARKAYYSLPIPGWVKEYLDPFDEHSNLGSLINAGHIKHCSDMKRHLETNAFKFSFFTKNQVSSQNFPEFAGRIEALREFVRDKNDKGFWHSLYEKEGHHTFWITVFGAIVAGLGLLLVMLILAAEIVQAWASVTTVHSLKHGA